MKFFKRKDGTIRTMNIVILLTIVFSSFFFLLLKDEIFRSFETKVEPIFTTTTTTTKTTTIQLCNGCEVGFTRESLDMSVNAEFDLSEITSLVKVNIRNATFEVENESIISTRSSGNTVYLKSHNNEGTSNLKIKYADKEATIKINTISTQNASVKFSMPYYFVSIKSKNKPEATLDVYPYAYNLEGIEYKATDSGIGKIDKKGILSGTKEGSTTITLTFGRITDKATLYVVPNLIKVKVKDSYGTYKEMPYLSTSARSAEIMIVTEDQNNNNFSEHDIRVSVNNGAAVPKGRGNEANSFLYYVEWNEPTTMRVELSDGSFTLFEFR